MAVSRRVRFEVLRRDGHRCRYCGSGTDTVRLTVDHVIPQALGGSDDPSNLVAACDPCNTGKASVQPDAPLVAQVEADALRWARALRRAGEMATARRAEQRERTAWFLRLWDSYSWEMKGQKCTVPLERGWEASVAGWLDGGLTEEDLTELVDVAMGARVSTDKVWRYFCGCAWNRLRTRQDEARELLRQEEAREAAGVMEEVITDLADRLAIP